MKKICELNKSECQDEVCELHKSAINEPDKSYARSGMHGVSEMGAKVRNANAAKDSGMGHKSDLKANTQIQSAKKIAGHVAKEIKSMPKPNLGKAETGHEKGVHLSGAIPGDSKSEHGLSAAGSYTRNIAASTNKTRPFAVQEHKKVLSDLKSMPKPNLGKSCEIHKGETGHEKGVHTTTQQSKDEDKKYSHLHDPEYRQSNVGQIVRDVHSDIKSLKQKGKKAPSAGFKQDLMQDSVRNTLRARNEHKTVLSDLKSMPKPNLGKSEDFENPESQEDSCPYCEDQESSTDDCQYCQDLDGKEGQTDDCPYCQDMDSKEGSEESCPYCDDMAIEQADPEQAQVGEEDHQCNCPNCPSSEGIAAVDDVHPESNGPDNCPECQEMYGDAIENEPGQTGQEPPKTQGHETAEEVLDMLDQEPGQGEPPAEEAEKIDNTELPQGDAMEDGTSVTENFGEAQKQDVSNEEQAFGEDQSQEDSEDQPDMSEVLRGGLDDHANEQKRAMIIDQVAQTLQGFKANKEFLEAAKEQSPGLYQSTIQMLKAMIALCELLGLQPKMEAQPTEQAPQADSTQAPPQSAAPQEGQSDPKAMG